MKALVKSKVFRQITFFMIFELLFSCVLAFGLIYYGPFVNIRENLVTTAMSTLHHKYIATWFLSQEEIDRIMAKNQNQLTENQNLDAVQAQDGDSSVQIVDVKTDRFSGKMLIISNPERVCVGTASTLGEGGMPLSRIVQNYKAIGGVNAGGFGDAKMVGTGAIPIGIIVENHALKYVEPDVSKFDIIGLNDKNVLVIGNQWTLADIQKKGIRDAITFGPCPPLVINGKPGITKGNGGMGIQPRTAIGQKKDGTILLLTIDGRQSHSIGASLRDLQDIFLKYDAYNAANLDGGSSATMFYQGNVVNNPSDILGERAIPSAFIIQEK